MELLCLETSVKEQGRKSDVRVLFLMLCRFSSYSGVTAEKSTELSHVPQVKTCHSNGNNVKSVVASQMFYTKFTRSYLSSSLCFIILMVQLCSSWTRTWKRQRSEVRGQSGTGTSSLEPGDLQLCRWCRKLPEQLSCLLWLNLLKRLMLFHWTSTCQSTIKGNYGW